jgi:hypothetical protein
MTIASSEAIADSGATQIFVMDGIPVHNRRKTTCPLKVPLADGRQVMSTHMCDIIIPGLPTMLIGHIVPKLSIASLFGIQVLTEAGCTVKFDIEKCVVKYNGKIILTGMKDPTADLWALPIVGSAGKTSPMNTHDEQDAFEPLRDELMERANAACGATTSSLAVPLCTSTQAYTMGGTANYTLPPPPPNEFGFFTHTVRTKANSIKFAHQSMCSPTISTLLKAIRCGYLDGCPNLSAKGVTRYLNLSPATAKGHMKRPHQGIRSTTAHQPHPPPSGRRGPTVHAAPIADDDSWIDDISKPSIQAGSFNHGPAVLAEDDNSSVGNIFCFAVFADKRTGVLYNDLTGSFPYMSLEGTVCYLIVYHYESTAALLRRSASLVNASTRNPRRPRLARKRKKRRTRTMSQRRTRAPIARNTTARSPTTSSRTNACGTKNIRDTASSRSAMSLRLISNHASNFWRTWVGMRRRTIRAENDGARGRRRKERMRMTNGLQ